jgi:uncharacterized membrane protein
MDTYELLLFLHLSAVAFWLGGELLFDILVFRAERQRDPTTVRKLFDESSALDPIFLPATVVVFATGILMAIDAGWSFDSVWVVIGLAGFAFIYLYGFLYLEPQVKRARAMIEREGGLGPQAHALVRRFFTLWRLETVVLFLLVLDMALKPVGEDVATLAFMGAVFVAAALFLLWRAGPDVVGAEATRPANER